MWSGTEWVSMTGGAGEDSGGGTPDDDYLRLDGANNPASPSDFIRSSYVDGVFLRLGGGTLTGALNLALSSTKSLVIYRADTAAAEWYLGMNTVSQLAWRYNGAAILLLDPNEVRLYKKLNAFGSAIYGPLDPTAGNEVGDRDYNDGRYLLQKGMLAGSGVVYATGALTSTQVVVASMEVALNESGIPYTADIVAAVRSLSMKPGDEFEIQIRVGGASSGQRISSGLPALSQPSHSHSVSVGSHTHSVPGRSHNHSVPSRDVTGSSGTTTPSGSTAHAHTSGSYEAASGTSGSTTPSTGTSGSTTPSGSSGSATPAVSGTTVAQNATAIHFSQLTAAGSTVLVELLARSTKGTPGELNIQMKAMLYKR